MEQRRQSIFNNDTFSLAQPSTRPLKQKLHSLRTLRRDKTRLASPRREMDAQPRASRITFYNERCQIASRDHIGASTSFSSAAKRGGSPLAALTLLPLRERRPGSTRAVSVYTCENGSLRVVEEEELRGKSHDEAGARLDKVAREAFKRCVERTQHALLPEPASVTNDYWEYARYRFAQRIASSCISVFATQQMLTAVGLGASRSLPAAAAVNWVLKDGLGRLGKLSVAANFGRTFDSDVKRFRFTSSVVYDASSFIEIITPYFPQHFLPLATVANIGKSVGITTANVVRAPIQRTFILEENLAEVAAKTSAQQVVADNIGLALAVGAAKTMSKIATVRPEIRRALPVFAFGPLAAMDLVCIYKELKAVQLRTINKERAEIIAAAYVKDKEIPSRAQVADTERLFIPARLDKSDLPLTVASIGDVCPTPKSLLKALTSKGKNANRPYILAYEPGASNKRVLLNGKRISAPKTSENGKKSQTKRGKLPWQRKRTGLKGRALLALNENATSKDVLCAILQVAHLRALPYRPDLTADEAYVWALQESESLAKRDIDAFASKLGKQGWSHERILLSSAERAPYYIDDAQSLITTLNMVIESSKKD